MAYVFTAAEVPVPIGSSLAVQRSAANSSSVAGAGNFPAFTPTVTSPQVFNQLLIDLDNAPLAGGMGCGVYAGLTVSNPAGLTLRVASGIAVAGGLVYNAANFDVTAPDNEAYVFVWIKQDGTIVVETTTTPPVSQCALVAVCTTLAGVVTVIDYSGVCYLKGGIAVRNTADTARPADAPGASPTFLTKCPSGTWLWDGAQYELLPGPFPLAKSTLQSGDAVYIPAGYQQLLFGTLTVPTGASVTVDGALQILP